MSIALMNNYSAGTTTFTYGVNSGVIDTLIAGTCTTTLYVQINATVATPANKTFVDANVSPANDTVTINNHPYLTGLAVTLTTTGVLPGGLATATPYYLIIVDANTIAFGSSLVNAKAGTKIDITSAAGGGTHTVNVTALAGATAQLQSGIDGSLFFNDGSSQNITTSGSLAFIPTQPIPARFYQVAFAITSGALTITTIAHSKGATQG